MFSLRVCIEKSSEINGTLPTLCNNNEEKNIFIPCFFYMMLTSLFRSLDNKRVGNGDVDIEWASF